MASSAYQASASSYQNRSFCGGSTLAWDGSRCHHGACPAPALQANAASCGAWALSHPPRSDKE